MCNWAIISINYKKLNFFKRKVLSKCIVLALALTLKYGREIQMKSWNNNILWKGKYISDYKSWKNAEGGYHMDCRK